MRVLVCDARNRCFKLVGCDRKLDWIVENGDAFDEFCCKRGKKSHNTKWHHEANEKKGSQRKSRLQKIKPSIKRSKQQQISSNKIKVDCTFIHEEEQQQRGKKQRQHCDNSHKVARINLAEEE